MSYKSFAWFMDIWKGEKKAVPSLPLRAQPKLPIEFYINRVILTEIISSEGILAISRNRVHGLIRTFRLGPLARIDPYGRFKVRVNEQMHIVDVPFGLLERHKVGKLNYLAYQFLPFNKEIISSPSIWAGMIKSEVIGSIRWEVEARWLPDRLFFIWTLLDYVPPPT